MYGRGYRCDRCAIGWHSSPSCPNSPGARFSPTIHEVQRQVHALNRVGSPADRDRHRRLSGPLPEIPPPLGFRWWWIPLGLVVFVALVILI
ncbi:hypothetical protein DFR71_6215 [Nocardia alba]|uniref:Uncharacterized protein n=1 Tax=Nocardia alba TaxID=225051 RepID=A0A4V2P9K4_9NOCA|nr:hypothetical protein DFR71_6215 [Nocardia alba]